MIKATHRVAHNVAPLYSLAASSAEQISQLVWGSPVEQIDSTVEFTRVVGDDLYVGWIRSDFLIPLDDDQDSATTTVATLFGEVYSHPEGSSELISRLTTGARIVLSRRATIAGFVPIDLAKGGLGYIHESQISLSYSSWMPLPPMSNEKLNEVSTEDLHRRVRRLQLDRVKHSSLLFIGVPYLWGGTTPFGLDCSGLTQLCYKISGIQLLRDAHQQRSDRRFKELRSAAGLAETPFRRADLLFFSNAKVELGRTTHVGIALGDGRFIHSVGKGRGTIVSKCSEPEFAETFTAATRLQDEGSLKIDSA